MNESPKQIQNKPQNHENWSQKRDFIQLIQLYNQKDAKDARNYACIPKRSTILSAVQCMRNNDRFCMYFFRSKHGTAKGEQR